MNRESAFGQHRTLTWADRLGVWLSFRQVTRWLGSPDAMRICDIGSGYHARLARRLASEGAHVTALDVALAPELSRLPGIRACEGGLPGILNPLADGEWDAVLCISVLEHLWDPELLLGHAHRMLRPGGILLLNVPSWRGKRALEFSAFRLGMSPAEEMDDHKAYYDPRDLWPLLVRAGFRPSRIRCFSHKFGLNTFAVCWKGEA